MSSTIVITYNSPTGDVDITNYVLWESTSFQTSAGAVPGSASINCRDMTQTLEFITGREISLSVDGQLLWAGHIRNVTHGYFHSADYIEDAEEYEARKWELDCVDYNVLLDKRVIRNPDDYLTIDTETFAAGTYDGDAVKYVLANYIDVPAGFDITSEIDNIGVINPTADGTYEAQGVYLRAQLQAFAPYTAPIYYISPDKKFHWHAIESVVKRWGLSDQPTGGAITVDPAEFQAVYIGFRDCVANEDGTPIVNDALVWGGSTLGSNASVVFSRSQDATSQNDHSRWQRGEMRVDEGETAGNQDGVDTIADAIVFGPPGSWGNDAVLRGLRYAQWQFSMTWFADDVPTLVGVRDHIIAGDLVTIQMNAFGVTRLMPCRQLTIKAAGVDSSGDGIIQFTGEFALNMDDPYQLWSFLLGRDTAGENAGILIVIVDNTSTTTSYGATYQDVPSPSPNGTQTLFSIPWGYIGGTLDLYLNGLLQRVNVDFYESDANAGEFTFSVAPLATDSLYAICRTLDA